MEAKDFFALLHPAIAVFFVFPLSWQEKHVYKLYELQCNIKPCTIQVSPESK